MASVSIDCRPDRLGGKTCIAGTRIPGTTLFNHLAIGGTIHSFAKEYPGVTAAQAQDVVTFAGRDMVGDPLAAERARVDVERAEVLGHQPTPAMARNSSFERKP